MTISKTAVERARAFVNAKARPLDQAALACALPGNANAPVDRLIAELARFQTPDGGFGNALEPDLRTPAPQVVAACLAFQYLRAVDAGDALPIVKAAVAYLVRAVDRSAWRWPIVDARIDDAPHAPWWSLEGLADRFNGFAFNPTAELLGRLYDHRALVPDDVVAGVEGSVLGSLEETEIIGGAYDLQCCLRLHAARGLPARVREILAPRLEASLEAADPDDPHLDLVAFAPNLAAFGGAATRAKIALQAERLIASQGEDGGWRPFWDWSAVDAEAWRRAEAEWSGVLTRQAVVNLVRGGFAAA